MRGPEVDWHAIDALLGALRDEGVQVRFAADYAMLFKPKFSELPHYLQVMIKRHELMLVRAMVPWENRGNAVIREGWEVGGKGVSACVGCRASTAVVDPIGQPRHPWCGFINQMPATTAPVRGAFERRKDQRRGNVRKA